MAWTRVSRRSASLSYQFSELENQESETAFDCSDENVVQKKYLSDSKGYRDYDQYRQTLISDHDYNDFLDFKDCYKDEEGNALLGPTELQVLDSLLMIEKGDDSLKKLAAKAGMSYTKFCNAKARVVRAYQIYQAEIAI
jgi:hypothetical protein